MKQRSGLLDHWISTDLSMPGSENLLRITIPDRKLRAIDEFCSWIAAPQEEKAKARRLLR